MTTTSPPLDLPAHLAHRQAIRDFSQTHYDALRRSRLRNAYFHRYLAKVVSNHVLPNARVLDIGCAAGDMLNALHPREGATAGGVGIDINPAAIADARQKYPHLTFHELAVEDLTLEKVGGEPFDYILLSGVLPQLYDLHSAMEALRPLCHDRTRIIVTTFSRLWHPVIRFGEAVGLKARVPDESWLPPQEVRNLLSQCDYQIVRQVNTILAPVNVPLLSNLVNRWCTPLPVLNHLAMCTVTIARMLPRANRFTPPASISIVIPARNEAGNIRPLLQRIPQMAPRQEVLFVEGNSTDDTWEKIQQVVAEYNAHPLAPGGNPGLSPSTTEPRNPERSPALSVSCLKQPGRGKGDAVRAGFAASTGDILIILDADISVMPEELPRFVDLLARGHAEFANGSRLVYPMDQKAMRFLNMLANKTFGWLFTYLLGQPIRDTLCGTKVLRRDDYLRIVANRAYFGDFDPFGDFDLLFGAARLNLKIQDVPVHYKQRTYGDTNISRFRHGALLFRMCGFAARKIKFV